MRFGIVKSRIFVCVALSFSFLVIWGCQSKSPVDSLKDAQEQFPQKMQNVAQEVGRLIPYIYSQKEFHDEKNAKKISLELKRFASSVHSIPEAMGKKILGDDPVVGFSLERLGKDIKMASESFEAGHGEYARSLLRGSLNHCFRCHTSSENGPEKNNSKLDFSQIRISPTEKADLYVALRQYDQALEILQGVLNDTSNSYEDPYEQERALKRYLAVMVRVRKDPAPALAVVDKFLQKPNVAYYLSEDARQWKKSLNEWKKEKPSKRKPMDQAKELIKRATRVQSFQNHQAANVLYLRATSILHEQSKFVKAGPERAQLYSMLGKSYDVLSDLGFWNLHEIYFEACVREQRNSPVARECYKDLERSVLWGFSGSAGTFLPKNEMERLKELKVLAGLENVKAESVQ